MSDSPNKNSDGVVTLTVSSDGKVIDDSIGVLSVIVEKRVNRIASAILTLFDGDMPSQDFALSNTNTFAPGARIEISAGYESRENTIFKGIVVRHGISIGAGNSTQLIVECHDEAIALTLGRKNTNYVDMTDSDIMSKVIGNYSLQKSVVATTVKHLELVQYYCSDWDFILALAEANGYVVLVDDGKVSVQAPQSQSADLVVTYGLDLISFSAEIGAHTQLGSVSAVSWDDKKQVVVKQEAPPVNLTGQGNLSSSDLAKKVGPDVFRLQTNAPISSSALKSWAEGRQLRAELERIQGVVSFQGNSKAVIGGVITLAGVGDRFNGDAYISAVRHKVGDGQWITDVEFGLSEPSLGVQGDTVAPAATGLVPAIQGLQIGVVMKLDEDPDGNYRVQVKIPLLEAKTEGVWARLSGNHASTGFGVWFIPEIGDEVVLGYLNSDPSYPIILGSLYSGKHTPPYEPDPKNNIKAVVTRSELKMEFDEEKKCITLLTPNGNTLVINDDEQSVQLIDENDNQVELSPSGILITSPKDIQIKATGDISLNAGGKIEQTATADIIAKGMNVKISGNSGVTAKGGATAELTSSGQTTVKGSMVMIN